MEEKTKRQKKQTYINEKVKGETIKKNSCGKRKKIGKKKKQKA